jgi:hypothetical protein
VHHEAAVRREWWHWGNVLSPDNCPGARQPGGELDELAATVATVVEVDDAPGVLAQHADQAAKALQSSQSGTTALLQDVDLYAGVFETTPEWREIRPWQADGHNLDATSDQAAPKLNNVSLEAAYARAAREQHNRRQAHARV